MNSNSEAPQTEDDPYLPVAEVAKIIPIEYGTLIQRCRRGTVECRKVAKGSKSTYFLRVSDARKASVTRAASGSSPGKVAPGGRGEGDDSLVEQNEMGDDATGVTSTGESRMVPIKQEGPFNTGKKRPLDHAKNAMRKLSAHDLLKVSTWINGRLHQRLAASSNA